MVLHIKLHVNGAFFFSSAPENAANKVMPAAANFEDHGFRDSEFDVLLYSRSYWALKDSIRCRKTYGQHHTSARPIKCPDKI